MWCAWATPWIGGRSIEVTLFGKIANRYNLGFCCS